MNGFCEFSRIKIENLKVYAYHGVLQEENEKGQNFYVNAVLFQDTKRAGTTDELSYSTDYGAVCEYINKWMKEHTFRLIESAAEGLAEDILLEFSLVDAVEIEIRKPEAPIKLSFESVSVHIKRGWHTAFLSVGSNMGKKEAYINNALKELGEDRRVKVLKVSDIISTKPYGEVVQDDFLNGVIKIRTLFSPKMLLDRLHELENNAGRERTIRWGPRTLDLDIIFYDDLVYEDDELIIPHVDMENREFVLRPMCELAPNMRHPLLKKTMAQLFKQLEEEKQTDDF